MFVLIVRQISGHEEPLQVGLELLGELSAVVAVRLAGVTGSNLESNKNGLKIET